MNLADAQKSFVAKCPHGISRGRTARGNKACNSNGCSKSEDCNSQTPQVIEFDKIELALDQASADQSNRNSQRQAENELQKRRAHHHGNDPRPVRAKGHAQPDLARTLRGLISSDSIKAD